MKMIMYLLLSYTVVLSQPERHTGVSYDSSRCCYCKMLVQDKEFGAELESDSCTIVVFDAIECLAAYLIDKTNLPEHIKHIWCVNYNKPATLIEAERAVFVHSDKLLSPMSMNVAAFSSQAEAERTTKTNGGDIVDWPGVLDLVRSRWFPSIKARVR